MNSMPVDTTSMYVMPETSTVNPTAMYTPPMSTVFSGTQTTTHMNSMPATSGDVQESDLAQSGTNAPCAHIPHWNAGYGKCHTYVPGKSNHKYCHMDHSEDKFAYQVC